MWGRVTASRRGDRSQLARERKVRTLPIMATTSLGGGSKSALPRGVRASLPSLGLGGAETCKCRVAFGLRRFMAPANSLLPRCHSFRPRQAEPQTHNLSVSWDRRHAADRLPAIVAAQCKDRGVTPSAILLREHKQRWGSCDSAGTLRQLAHHPSSPKANRRRNGA